MASGLAERKKPEHIHNPSGPRAFLLKPHYKELSGSAGPGSGYARGRVAVKGRGLGTLGGEWQCVRDCHSGVNVPGRYARGRVAVQPTLPLGRERTGPVRSGPSGSEGTGPGHARGRVAVRTGLPLGRERAGTVRSGASGSVTFIGVIGSLAPAPPASRMRASF